MTHVQENCGCSGDGEWALWITPSTIAVPRSRLKSSSTFRLQASPEVLVEVGDLNAEETEIDRRTQLSKYAALRLTDSAGESLTAEDAARILRGPLRLEVLKKGHVVERTGIQIARVLDAIYAGAAEENLGITWDGDTPTLALWAPTAVKVSLLLWVPGASAQQIEVTRNGLGVWKVVGEPEWEDAEYLWEVRVYVPSLGSLKTNRVTDPYSVGLTIDSLRSVIVRRNRDHWQPQGWGTHEIPPLPHPASQAIYELHVRDFSAWDDTVPVHKRGTYAAFTEDDSMGIRALRELAEAGITTLHLLPTFDISTSSIPEDRNNQKVPEVEGIPLLPGNVDKLEALPGWSRDSGLPQQAVAEVADLDAFNWGYDPQHWFTPEGSYATAGSQVGGSRTYEYREMVQALHSMGLRVVQDVVFNHTFASGQQPTSVLDKIVPGYYHRLSAEGVVENSTCCANIATEHIMAEKMMVDALVDAATQYKIDGFRFDLMGHHSMDNMRAVRAALDALTPESDGVNGKEIYLYGEGWNFGEVADDVLFTQATQKNIAGSGIGVFNDRLRDAVRGGSTMDEDHRKRQGFATGLAVDPNEVQDALDSEDAIANMHVAMDLIKVSLLGAITDFPLRRSDGDGIVMSQDVEYFGQGAAFAAEPAECVNYVEAHDDESLFDASIWKLPLNTPAADRVAVQALANATVMLGQGVAFWASGTELLRSKSLDRDSYNSGDWFNAIDWSGQWSHFGRGLPSAGRNRPYWRQMAPLLAQEDLRPGPENIATTRELCLGLLRIRRDEPLLTLGSAEEIRERVHFLPTGEDGADKPGVIAMWIDGRGRSDEHNLLVVFNATPQPWNKTVPTPAGDISVTTQPRAVSVSRQVVDEPK